MIRQDVAHAFGTVLRTLRRSAGLSQQDLAERANLNRTYPTLLERGLRTPTLEVLLRIAAVFHLDGARIVQLTMRELRGRSRGAP